MSHNSKDNEVVRAIAKRLQDKGISVWFDEWNLTPGRPWQEELEEGIENTNSIAVFVSAHGLGRWEKPELRAALSESADRGISVIPVLLPGGPSPEALPLFLKAYTCVDMRSGVHEVGVSRIESGVRRELSRLSEREDGALVASLMYGEANLRQRNPDFVGRLRLKTEVRKFITQNDGYLILVGGMGSGKTAFLTELVHDEIEAGREPICHFIDYHPSFTGEGHAIVGSLLSQLRHKYVHLTAFEETQRDLPPKLPERLEWVLRSLSERFSWGRGPVPPEVIYIDAADQAKADERQPLLPGYLRRLPPGVVCVITTRPDQQWLRTRRGVTVWHLNQAIRKNSSLGLDNALDQDFDTDPELVDSFSETGTQQPTQPVEGFDDPLLDDRTDIRTYLTRQLPQLLPDISAEAVFKLVDRIVSQDVPPVFFTVRKCLGRFDIPEHRQALLTQPTRWCAAPEDLVAEEAILAEDRAHKWGLVATDFWHELGVVALAGEPICEATWRGLGLWRDQVTPLALRAAANFFRPIPHAPNSIAPIEFDHPGYAREVRRRLVGREAEQHGELADACLVQLEPGALRDYRAASQAASARRLRQDPRAYAVSHVVEHLTAATGRDAQRRELLLRYDWLESRLWQDGIWEVLADYSEPAKSDPLHNFAAAIRRSVQTLSSDPRHLPAQLLGRLEETSHFADVLTRAARITRFSWIRPLTPTLTSIDEPLVWTLQGHEREVHSTTVTLDGLRAISASRDGTLKVWDLAKGRLERTLDAHVRNALSVAVTPDGHMAVSGSEDGWLRSWDLENGQLQHKLEAHSGEIGWVAVTPDRLRAISLSGYDGTLKIWDMLSGRLERTLPVIGIRTSLWKTVTPDVRRAILTTGNSEERVYRPHEVGIWNLTDGRCERLLNGFEMSPGLGWVTPDNTRAIWRGMNRNSRGGIGGLDVWNLDSGNLEWSLTGHDTEVRTVALTPDGRFLISSDENGSLRLWNLEKGQLEHVMEAHTAHVSSVVVTPDGRSAISASADRTLRIWDLRSGSLEMTLEGHTRDVLSVAVTPDGRRAISGSRDCTVRVWDLTNYSGKTRKNSHTGWVRSVAITGDSQRVISASGEELKVWDLASGQLERTLDGHTDTVTAIAVTPDGKHAIAGSADGLLRVWDLDSGRMERSWEGHTFNTLPVTDTPHGPRKVKRPGLQYLRNSSYDSYFVTSMAVTSDGQNVVSVSDDGTLRVWNLVGRQLQLMDNTDLISSVALTPDGRRAISKSFRDLKVWDLTQGSLQQSHPLDSEVSPASAIAVTQDGRFAVYGTKDGSLILRHLADGQLERIPDVHTSGINSVVVTKCGRRAISASDDHTLRVWDLCSRQLVASFVSDWRIVSCAVAGDGRTFAAGDEGGRVHFLRLVESEEDVDG